MADTTGEDDLRSDDKEYNPAIEPKKAKAWLNLLHESEDAFEELERPLRQHRQAVRQPRAAALEHDARQGVPDVLGQCEVLKPTIYAKPPVPVVVPKFKDRRPVYQHASRAAGALLRGGVRSRRASTT